MRLVDLSLFLLESISCGKRNRRLTPWCIPVAFPAAIPGRLARHRRLRLCDPQPHGRTVAAISEQGVYLLSARLLRGVGDHAVARDQGRQAASAGCRSVIVGGWLICITGV